MAEPSTAPQTPAIIMALGDTELFLKWSELNGEKEQLSLTTPIWWNNAVCKDGGKVLLVNLFAAKIQLLLVTFRLCDSPGLGQHAEILLSVNRSTATKQTYAFFVTSKP